MKLYEAPVTVVEMLAGQFADLVVNTRMTVICMFGVDSLWQGAKCGTSRRSFSSEVMRD